MAAPAPISGYLLSLLARPRKLLPAVHPAAPSPRHSVGALTGRAPLTPDPSRGWPGLHRRHPHGRGHGARRHGRRRLGPHPRRRLRRAPRPPQDAGAPPARSAAAETTRTHRPLGAPALPRVGHARWRADRCPARAGGGLSPRNRDGGGSHSLCGEGYRGAQATHSRRSHCPPPSPSHARARGRQRAIIIITRAIIAPARAAVSRGRGGRSGWAAGGRRAGAAPLPLRFVARAHGHHRRDQAPPPARSRPPGPHLRLLLLTPPTPTSPRHGPLLVRLGPCSTQPPKPCFLPNPSIHPPTPIQPSLAPALPASLELGWPVSPPGFILPHQNRQRRSCSNAARARRAWPQRRVGGQRAADAGTGQGRSGGHRAPPCRRPAARVSAIPHPSRTPLRARSHSGPPPRRARVYPIMAGAGTVCSPAGFAESRS